MSKQFLEELIQAANELSKGNKVKGWRPYMRRQAPLQAYYNKRLGWVVKHPVFIMDHRTPLGVRVSTIALDNGWVAQPIVQKIRLKEAYNAIKWKLLRFGHIHPDLHVGNIGWFRDEAVMFDW
jgi:hypothetical protein